VIGTFEHDLVRYIGSSNLDYFVKRCCTQRSPVTDVLAGYSLIHLNMRGEVLDFATYEEAIKAYGSPRFRCDRALTSTTEVPRSESKLKTLR